MLVLRLGPAPPFSVGYLSFNRIGQGARSGIKNAVILLSFMILALPYQRKGCCKQINTGQITYGFGQSALYELPAAPNFVPRFFYIRLLQPGLSGRLDANGF